MFSVYAPYGSKNFLDNIHTFHTVPGICLGSWIALVRGLLVMARYTRNIDLLYLLDTESLTYILFTNTYFALVRGMLVVARYA